MRVLCVSPSPRRTLGEGPWTTAQWECLEEKGGEPAGTRTQDPRLKRALLYRLSYRLTRAEILPGSPALSPRFGTQRLEALKVFER